MHGRPGICWPVWMKVMPGSWLIASVCIDRMIAMSFAMLAVCGRSSENQAPFPPCWENSKTDGAIGKRDWPEVIVVSRCPWRIDSGRSWSKYSFIFGL